VLKTTEHVAGETGLPVEIGMSSEMVLGFHGQLEYDGVRLAGLWPHQQLELCEKAGTAIFGPVVNTNTRKSTPWNLSRAGHLRQGLQRDRQDPDPCNVGMGVGRGADVRGHRPSTP